jgi:putative transposase
MEIVRKSGKWYASVTFETLQPYRASGAEALGIDWGTMKFLSIVTDSQKIIVVENPRHLRAVEQKLKRAQRTLSKKKKGSANRKKAKAELNQIHERLAFKREDFLHQTSASLIKKARFIATEELNVKGMTSSGGSFKSGLNRSILDTSPGKFFQMLKYKAADAGISYVEVPTRKIKPSQTCSGCAAQEKKLLSERRHFCKKCGLDLDRDANSGFVILNYALTGSVTGQELALGVEGKTFSPLKHETPSIAFDA